MSSIDRRLNRMSMPSAKPGGKVKRALGVQAALEWAFRVEKAQLELPLPQNVTEEGFGFGLEYVLLQRAALGCKVDGGQHKIGGYTHEDAEVIAATVAGIPDSLGGKRMAIRVAELARAGLTPDWMPGAVPRCVPVDVRRNRYGERAATVVVGTVSVLARGKWRTVEVLACPVTFSPHPQQIDAARRAYDDWWQALGWIRDGLITGGMLRDVEVTSAMPVSQPWTRGRAPG
ncbi:MAG: Thiazole biosynthesis protein ThiG [Rhodobacteraceae bacterium HLUCCA12]|nr:MAG: Thiazole biosynthesis protein ThiG [Rhodobacteraceae bacterium HLUCCA12]